MKAAGLTTLLVKYKTILTLLFRDEHFDLSEGNVVDDY